MSDLSAETILREVSAMVNKDVSFIDALVYYAESNGLELEVLGDIVRRSQVIKARVYEDAEKYNLVKRIIRLPIDVRDEGSV